MMDENTQKYEEECPHIIDGEKCPAKAKLDWLMAVKPWYAPGVPALVFGGFTRTHELHFRLEDWKDFETTKAIINDLREKFKLDKYLIFKKCPECELELPASDFNTTGECVFCSERARRGS